MDDLLDPTASNASLPSPENLGQAYQPLLNGEAWEVDGLETSTETESSATGLASETVPPPIHRILEALLFIGGSPLTAERAGETIRGLTPDQFTGALDILNKDYRRQGRPYTIRCQDKGYVLSLRPNFRFVLDKLYGGIREARLSSAAIDILALVAYRQPATKAEVDSLRGAESGAILRQLVRRGLIAIVHRGESNQREVYYGTTARFLEMFGLANLDDLPHTQDVQLL
ncbi:MAG TPA: SMC-Scp complex subunit ScpB [Gemmataceae bacterium]|jgi:segregation and condensation protein B|nr:SMC-Scp complex subunit ScpB [Gemmataceae bacterium]